MDVRKFLFVLLGMVMIVGCERSASAACCGRIIQWRPGALIRRFRSSEAAPSPSVCVGPSCPVTYRDDLPPAPRSRDYEPPTGSAQR